MRKTLIALSAAAAVAVTAPAMAQPNRDNNSRAAAALGTGAVVGTAVGVSQYNGWWGPNWFSRSFLGTGLERSFAASAATGIVTGVGTVVLIDAATQPCRGFRAFFAPFRGVGHERGCRGGEWVG